MFRSLRVWIGFVFSAVLVGLFFTLVDLSDVWNACLLYTSPSPRDGLLSRMPSSA